MKIKNIALFILMISATMTHRRQDGQSKIHLYSDKRASTGRCIYK